MKTHLNLLIYTVRRLSRSDQPWYVNELYTMRHENLKQVCTDSNATLVSNILNALIFVYKNMFHSINDFDLISIKKYK